MKLAFTTLACPKWDLKTVCAKAREYGYDGIDFRGLQETLDITTLPAFTSQIAETRKIIADAGIETCGVSTSINVCDAKKLEANLAEAKRTIPVALGLGAKNIRIFGGGDVATLGKEGAAKIGRECIGQILGLPGARQLNWLFETHDNWISGADCRLLLDAIPDPAFGALWDIGHTPRVGGETPEQTYAAIGKRVRYTHIKDAIYDKSHPQAMSDGWRYVACGEGTVPLAEAIALLQQGGYTGYLVFEHEKKWHPELPEPEAILPKFTAWARRVLRSLQSPVA
jgi:sugar phosphate isomerase/epimerase